MGRPAYRGPAGRVRGTAYRRSACGGDEPLARLLGQSTPGGRGAGYAHPLTSFEGDRWQVQRDQEVFEEVLDHANLVVEAVVALQQV